MYNCMNVVINFGETTREVKTRIFLINFFLCLCACMRRSHCYFTGHIPASNFFYKLSWTEAEQLINTVCIIAFHSAA